MEASAFGESIAPPQELTSLVDATPTGQSTDPTGSPRVVRLVAAFPGLHG